MSSDPIVAIRDVSFSYDNAAENLFSDLSVHFPAGFTGVIGANGAGKTTLLRIICSDLQPDLGVIQGVHGAIYCEQRTDDAPVNLPLFLQDWDHEAIELRGRLGIEPDFYERWHLLSHGERKRTQIGFALWHKPDLLAIDEPTNHIDSDARDLLITSLKNYRGVGIIVSHDRELLDELCIQCLWFEPPTVRTYIGGFTQASEQRQTDQNTAIQGRKKLTREHKKLQQEVVRRREKSSAEHSNRSKRGLSRKDSDAREKIDRARVADSKSGQTLRQLSGKSEQQRVQLAAAHIEKDYETGIWLPGSTSQRDTLFNLESGQIPLGPRRVLRHPNLVMKPTDRIALTGLNGTGKSTLVQHLVNNLNVPADKLVVIQQEITADEATKVLNDARALENEKLGHLMNVVSRLGSRPQRLLASRQPSPGEIRKLLLALGMGRAPHLIVMDEPTNHLDIPSIEALESALSDSPCGLLLVSHDQRFLGRIVKSYWHLASDSHGNSHLTVD
jgi:macrolide transport system ATP-binding/permease protein